MLREVRRDWRDRRGGITGDIVELAAHTENRAREWYQRLGMVRCRWWEREQGRWAVQGDGLYIPEEPPVEEGGRGGILMRTTGAALESELQRREESRGTGAGGIRYHLFTGIDELRERGVHVVAGARAMANRVYAGQSW